MTQDCTDSGSAVDSESRRTISTIMWIVGGVLVAGGIVTFVAWPKEKETTAWLFPVVGPHEAGAAFGATF
jgi:hypothetical protein